MPSHVTNAAPVTWRPVADCPQPGNTSDRQKAAPGLMGDAESGLVLSTWADRRVVGLADSNTTTAAIDPPIRRSEQPPVISRPALSVSATPPSPRTRAFPARAARRPDAAAAARRRSGW